MGGGGPRGDARGPGDPQGAGEEKVAAPRGATAALRAAVDRRGGPGRAVCGERCPTSLRLFCQGDRRPLDREVGRFYGKHCRRAVCVL